VYLRPTEFDDREDIVYNNEEIKVFATPREHIFAKSIVIVDALNSFGE
jgi:hypothetical protein